MSPIVWQVPMHYSISQVQGQFVNYDVTDQEVESIFNLCSPIKFDDSIIKNSFALPHLINYERTVWDDTALARVRYEIKSAKSLYWINIRVVKQYKKGIRGIVKYVS